MKWAGHYASLVSASLYRSPTLHTNSQVAPSQTVFQILKECIRKERGKYWSTLNKEPRRLVAQEYSPASIHSILNGEKESNWGMGCTHNPS